MVTWVPGHSDCTASASTWAASWRISSRARGSSRLTNSIFASRSIGSARSASAPSSAIATVRLASDGEIALATSKPVMPLGYSRRAPSGKVSATKPVAAIFQLLLLTRCLRTQVSGSTLIYRRFSRRFEVYCSLSVHGYLWQTVALHIKRSLYVGTTKPAIGVPCRGKVFRSMVPIGLFQGASRHAEILACLVYIGLGFHMPCCSTVPKHMRRDVTESDFFGDEANGLIEASNWVATPLHHIPCSLAVPSSQMSQ